MTESTFALRLLRGRQAAPPREHAQLPRLTRTDRVGFAVAAGWLVLAVAVLAATGGASRAQDWLDTAAYLVPLAAAFVLLVAATGGRERRLRIFFGSFSTFVLLTLAGDLVFALTDTVEAPGARPSAADALYVAAYVALLPGVIGGLRRLGSLRASVAWFDAAIATASLAYAGGMLLVEPVLHDPTSGRIVATLYPLLDIVALMVFVPIVLGLRSAPPGAHLLLGSFAAAIVADSAYAYYSVHGRSVFDTWFVLCYQVQFLLLALGGLYALQRAMPVRSDDRARDIGLPLALLGLAAALVVLGHAALGGGTTMPERAGVALLFLLVVGRMMVAERNLRRAERAEHARGVQLERLVGERTAELAASEAELRRSREGTIRRLAEVIGLRDEETGGHTERIGLSAALLAERLGLDRSTVELLRITGPLHDIGKIAIPDSILRKPGPLTPEERAEMELHTVYGHHLLSGSGQELLDFAAELALTHHERIDGTGYPNGLAGEEIPICGRIVAVCDVFDALTSDRVYRPALPLEEALEIMRAGRGTQFDAVVLDAFFASLPAVLRLREQTGERTIGDVA